MILFKKGANLNLRKKPAKTTTLDLLNVLVLFCYTLFNFIDFIQFNSKLSMTIFFSVRCIAIETNVISYFHHPPGSASLLHTIISVLGPVPEIS